MHIPIMTTEIYDTLNDLNINTIIDTTFGSGGHTKIFQKLNIKYIFAMDQDPLVVQYKIPNIPLVIDTFSNVNKYHSNYDFIFADLGMSTMQIEDTTRGFSFMRNGPLNMSMNINSSTDKLFHLLNREPIWTIEDILNKYGQVFNKSIISSIGRYRISNDITDTAGLIRACGTNEYKKLAKVFQALRIFINDEMTELDLLLRHGNPSIGWGFLTFHSLEDNKIKHFSSGMRFKKLITPSKQEIQNNPQSRSCRFRLLLK